MFFPQKFSKIIIQWSCQPPKAGRFHSLVQDSYSSCWHCKKKHFKNFLVCGACNYLQDPRDSIYKLSYFQLFEIMPNFTINQKELDQKFKQLQMSFHPDRIKNDEKNIKNYSQSYSAYINEAYQTLRNDFKRALYMLKLEGFVSDSERKIQEDEYLEKILDIREQICENDPENMKRIKAENEKNKSEIVAQLKEHLGKKNFEKALDIVFKFQYLIAIDEAILSQEEKNEL